MSFSYRDLENYDYDLDEGIFELYEAQNGVRFMEDLRKLRIPKDLYLTIFRAITQDDGASLVKIIGDLMRKIESQKKQIASLNMQLESLKSKELPDDKIQEYIREFGVWLTPSGHNDLFRSFKECDMPNLAAWMKQFIYMNHKKAQEQDNKIDELSKAIYDLQSENNALHEFLFKSKEWQYSFVKKNYEKGRSLRAIGKMLGCDKSTVKRMLIKMGVPIRKK